MPYATHRHSPGRLALTGRVGTAMLLGCLAASCDSRSEDPATRPSRTASSTPSGTPFADGAETRRTTGPTDPPPPTTEPTKPAASLGRPARDAAALADQLDLAAATLADPDVPRTAVRRAGELHQLAVRTLATAPRSFVRDVTRRVEPGTRRLVRGDVRAARTLRSLTPAQGRLPRWRIVAPPPPAELLGHYRAAERRTGVPWSYLAAIHLVETRMGRIRGTSTAGARGPMQFLPTTWDLYGQGGDINDPADAILAAARLLRANGAPRDMAGALWHYNPSDRYVRAVTEHAGTMQRTPAAYRGYWHWQVLYRHAKGTYLLPVGYPRNPPVRLPGR
jgi:hypothetical protein